MRAKKCSLITHNLCKLSTLGFSVDSRNGAKSPCGPACTQQTCKGNFGSSSFLHVISNGLTPFYEVNSPEENTYAYQNYITGLTGVAIRHGRVIKIIMATYCGSAIVAQHHVNPGP